jgi:hypothetical protein
LEPRADERKATCVLSEEEMRSMPARTDCEGVRLVDWWTRARDYRLRNERGELE